MKVFNSKKVFKSYTQINKATPDKVFPLLCPVREKDWLSEWEYKMVYSKSGFAELGCVFTTPHHHSKDTTWVVTKYDPNQYSIGFIRFTPDEQVVKISIGLSRIDDKTTSAEIEYEYTSLNQAQNEYFDSQLDEDFLSSMKHWEKAINYYLETGQILGTNSD